MSTSFYTNNNKVNFLFIVHATPEFPNDEKCLLGDLDVPLSKEGEREAENLKDSLKKCGLVFDMVFSSDLQRASKTAEILAFDSSVSVQLLSIFRETNKGDLQGLTQDQYREEDSYKEYKAKSNPFFACLGKGENVESKADLAKRLIPWINEVRNDSSLCGKTIVVVTHGNPLKVVDTLSRNKRSLDSSENLEDRLQEIPKYSEPQSCDIYWFTGDSHSFEPKGKILFNDNGEITVGPSLQLGK